MFCPVNGKIRWKFRNTAECPVKKGKEIQRNKVVAAQTLDDESVHGHRGGASEGSGCPTPRSAPLFPLNSPPRLQGLEHVEQRLTKHPNSLRF